MQPFVYSGDVDRRFVSAHSGYMVSSVRTSISPLHMQCRLAILSGWQLTPRSSAFSSCSFRRHGLRHVFSEDRYDSVKYRTQ